MTDNLKTLKKAAAKAISEYFDLLIGNYDEVDDGRYRYKWYDDSDEEKAEIDRMIDELRDIMDQKLQEYEDACNDAGVEPEEILDLNDC